MPQTVTYSEFYRGDKVRQYLEIAGTDGRAQYREVSLLNADKINGGWTMTGRLNPNLETDIQAMGWKLAGLPKVINLTVNEYDDLYRVIGVPKSVWTTVLLAQEEYKDKAKAARNLDKDLPVDPLTTATRAIGGVRKYEVPLDFLHEGTEFTVTRKHEVIDGVADMDGASVSPTHGRVNGTAHFIGNDNPESYINVRFNGRHYTKSGPGVNEGLSVKKGDKVWVSKGDYDRYVRDHAALIERTEQARTAVKRGELQRELASARAIIERVEAQLAELS